MNPFSPPLAAGSLPSPGKIPAASGGLYVSAFLRRLRRRMMIVRTLEASGIGLLVAAGFSLLLALLLLATGRDAMRLSVVALAAGACLGAAWSLRRRPTLLDAAIETDRQMNLADLLATAFTRCGTSDSWQAAVIAMADQRCKNLSPADVILARFGARAWGGIGLSAALVLAVGALSASPHDSRAMLPGSADSAAIDSSIVSSPFLPTPAQPDKSLPAVPVQFVTPEKTDDAAPAGAPIASQNPRQGSSAGNGSRSAKTSAATVPPTLATASPAAPPAPNGIDAATGGQGASSPSPNTDRTLSKAAGPPARSGSPSPPWRASTWPQDRAAAGRAVQDGRVPDACRDVLQHYFQPE